MKKTLFTFSLLILSSMGLANDLDISLKEIILENNLKPLEPIKAQNSNITRLGSMLYHEGALSGNKDINCVSCHHPMVGTSDGLPFSIGTGGRGMGTGRQQRTAGVTKRHSPHLINIGYTDFEFMFWDGRVHRDNKTGVLTTPEPALNGVTPVRKDIAETLTSAVAAQTIFPIVNGLEMMGENNNISKAHKEGGNLKAWEAIMNRLLTGDLGARYLKEFKKAFPNATNFHIGHAGEAMGAFISRSFNVIDTPYDRYLKGDSTALTESEKRGLLVFSTKGKCTECHSGPHLTNNKFDSAAVPQLIKASLKAPYDQGRYEVTGDNRDLYRFRVPPLRNLAITAPYMHNGAFATLDQVVEHYRDPHSGVSSLQLNDVDLSNYNSQFIIDRDMRRNMQRIHAISVPTLRHGVQMSEDDKKDLLEFLETGLLDYRFQPQRMRQ